MNYLTFPRALLKDIPEQRRQEQVDHVIQSFIKELRWVAGQGDTHYVYHPSPRHQSARMPYLTSQQMLLALRQRFPDCKVYWAECETNCHVYKRAIVIDWA